MLAELSSSSSQSVRNPIKRLVVGLLDGGTGFPNGGTGFPNGKERKRERDKESESVKEGKEI